MKKLFGILLVFVAALVALPLAVTFDADGNPSYTPWTDEMKDAMYANFKVLDAAGEGLDRSKLRLFYPMIGWNDLQVGIDALIADGRLESKIIAINGTTPVEHFIWKGA